MFEHTPQELLEMLAAYPGLSHLKVRKRGDSLILYSGEGQTLHNHARFTHLGRNTWGLSLPRHTGRWERTPFVAPLPELVQTLVEDFGFYLHPM